MIKNIMYVAAVVCSAIISPAIANASTFRVEAGEVEWIDLNVCSPRISLSATGDGDTDLDFVLFDPDGNKVHEDIDNTDFTFVTFRTRLFASDNICRTFKLKVTNYGRIWNALDVKLEKA